MSYRYITHLTALERSARTNSENAAFKVPSDSKSASGWRNITYGEFWDDVTRLAVYWSKRLEGSATRNGDVVGLWMAGETYIDVIHLFGLQRAGYTLRLMRPHTQDIDLIQSQFKELGVQVVVCDTKCTQEWEQLQKAGIKVIPFLTHEEIVKLATKTSSLDSNILPPLDGNGDDILLIMQSSGSTSGRPKVIPLTRRWMDAGAQKCQIDNRVPVAIRTGSICTSAQTFGLLRAFIHAHCIVLSPKLGWEANELASIITQCGVTNIILFPSLIDKILEQAKTSNSLARALRTLKNMTFVGGPLAERAFENAKELDIRIASRFGSTEMGPMMSFEPALSGKCPLKFDCQFDYEFIPFKDGNGDNTTLHELVVLPTSPDCPVAAYRNPMDGKYYTKDLFEVVEEGYIFRGRTSDTILLRNAALCDVKYIEDRIEYFCHDLISCFVVVGEDRPSLALLVESKEGANATTTDTLRKTLSTRLETLNSSMGYRRERIKLNNIIILPKGSLPVSPGKGAVVRSKAELMFKEMLDEVYASE